MEEDDEHSMRYILSQQFQIAWRRTRKLTTTTTTANSSNNNSAWEKNGSIWILDILTVSRNVNSVVRFHLIHFDFSFYRLKSFRAEMVLFFCSSTFSLLFRLSLFLHCVSCYWAIFIVRLPISRSLSLCASFFPICQRTEKRLQKFRLFGLLQFSCLPLGI